MLDQHFALALIVVQRLFLVRKVIDARRHRPNTQRAITYVLGFCLWILFAGLVELFGDSWRTPLNCLYPATVFYPYSMESIDFNPQVPQLVIIALGAVSMLCLGVQGLRLRIDIARISNDGSDG